MFQQVALHQVDQLIVYVQMVIVAGQIINILASFVYGVIVLLRI